jgi:Helix-turn-helix domain
MTIQRFNGVLLDLDEAAYLAGALSRYCEILRADGKQARPRLESLRAKLSTAATVQTTSAGAGCAAHSAENGDDIGHVIGTGAACQLLGISPNGVRDLARRGRIRARQTGTRWFYSAADAERYAEDRAERMER